MALANKNESAMAIIQESAFYDQDFGGPSLLHHTSSHSSPEGHIYGPSRPVYGDPESPEKAAAKNFTVSNSSTVSSPSSTNSNGGLGFQHTNYTTAAAAEEGNSVITFKPEFANFIHGGGAGSLLSFDQAAKSAVRRNLNPRMMAHEDDQFPMWEGDYMNVKPSAAADAHGVPETSNASAVEYESPNGGGAPWGWLNDHDGSGVTNGGGEEMETANNKRPSTGENSQAMKKQCGGSKKAKPKSAAESKDPQSVAAKNRRERISERLKLLQELVPNGSKVDLVTMLEKAISYVKFLQLQVKVLATDEFWPAQGGQAPDLCQVREAIDAILASQRDRSSSSK